MAAQFGVQRRLCPVCIGFIGGECPRCNGTGYVYRDTYAPEAAIDAPDDQELELERLKRRVRQLAAPVCCPSCGAEVERSGS